MPLRPIFVTARFRSGSTLLWNMFRHLPGCVSYYEPCNESLLTHIENDSQVDPNHRNVESSYWNEYRPVLDGVRARHQLEFGVSRLFLEERETFSELEEYVRYLSTAVTGRVPVFQFNRIDFRLPWIRKCFPDAFLLHLRRNSRDNWFSMVRILPEGEWRNPLQDARESLVLWSVALYHAFPFLFSPLVSTTYHRHYLLWRLSGLAGERQAELTLDFDLDILADPRGAAKKLAELAGQVDADIDALAKLVVLPERGRWKELADEAWFASAEAECDALLDSLGLLEDFGRLPLADIVTAHEPAWELTRRDSAELLSHAASMMSATHREGWLKLRGINASYVTNYENVLDQQRRDIQYHLSENERLQKALGAQKGHCQNLDEEVLLLGRAVAELEQRNTAALRRIAELEARLEEENVGRQRRDAEITRLGEVATELEQRNAEALKRLVEIKQSLDDEKTDKASLISVLDHTQRMLAQCENKVRVMVNRGGSGQ